MQRVSILDFVLVQVAAGLWIYLFGWKLAAAFTGTDVNWMASTATSIRLTIELVVLFLLLKSIINHDPCSRIVIIMTTSFLASIVMTLVSATFWVCIAFASFGLLGSVFLTVVAFKEPISPLTKSLAIVLAVSNIAISLEIGLFGVLLLGAPLWWQYDSFFVIGCLHVAKVVLAVTSFLMQSGAGYKNCRKLMLFNGMVGMHSGLWWSTSIAGI